MMRILCAAVLAGIMAQGTLSAQDREVSARYRQAAFDYLAWVQTNPMPEYLPKIRQLVSDVKDEQIRVVAVRTVPGLVRAGADASDAVDLLRDLYDDSDSLRVKQAVLVALSSIGVLEAFDALLAVAESEREPSLVQRAFWAMRRLTGCRYPDMLNYWYLWREGQRKLLAETFTEIESGERDRVLGAMMSFSQMTLRSSELMEMVSAYLYDTDPALREAACNALAVHKDYPPQVRERLAEMAEGDADEGVRKAAMAALGKQVEEEEQIASR